MRRTLAVWLGVALAGGLGSAGGAGGAQLRQPGSSVELERNKATVERWIAEGFNQGNLGTIDEIFDEGFVVNGERIGRVGLKQSMRRHLDAFPDLRVTITDVVAEGDRVVIWYTVQATHRGEFEGIRPTGKRVTWSGADLLRIVGGKIVEARFISDAMGLLRQLGATDSTPPAQNFPPGSQSEILRIPSRDGTPIVIECAGKGPTLVMVHGGTGDRTRWTPMLPLLSRRLRACAMDRRGHGASGDSPDYSLLKEAEDVAAVVDSLPGTVFVLGHSYGGVAALEATILTGRIAKIIIYEAPLQDRIDVAVIDAIERLIAEGKREQAVLTFLSEVVKLSDEELQAMPTRPSWPSLLETIDEHPRQMRALAAYRFDPERMRRVRMPTLLLAGSETASTDLQRAIASLQSTLPDSTTVVLEGQQHNAMDSGREQLADAILEFLVGSSNRDPG